MSTLPSLSLARAQSIWAARAQANSGSILHMTTTRNLVIGFAVIAAFQAGHVEAQSPTPKQWNWTSMGSLSEPRELPRLAKRGQEVLIVGGGSELRATALATTELFNPQRKIWTPGPPLNVARRDPEVVTDSDGRIYAIGGSTGATRVGSNSIEVLEPSSQTWKMLSPMKDGRIGHTAILLDDGRILVAGGQSAPEQYLATVEIFVPNKNEWISAGVLSEARAFHHARQLKNGLVAVFGGGTDSTATNTVDILDTKTLKWQQAAPMLEPRWGFASAVLDDGRLLVAGGRIPAQKASSLSSDVLVILDTTELYDPIQNKWVAGPRMNVRRSMGLPNVSLQLLPNRGLLFMGGRTYPGPYHGTRSAEYYDVRLNRWVLVQPMTVGRSYQSSLVLRSGEILVAGGRGTDFLPLNSVECFEPKVLTKGASRR